MHIPMIFCSGSTGDSDVQLDLHISVYGYITFFRNCWKTGIIPVPPELAESPGP